MTVEGTHGNTYREDHTLGWIYGLLLVVLLGVYAVVTVGAIAKHKWTIAILIGVLMLAVILAMINFWRLTFEITATNVAFGFGLIVKRFPRTSIITCKPYELTFSNYMGYGIRRGVDGTTAYNTRNGPGVILTVEGEKRPYVVSVDEPAYICKVLAADGGTGAVLESPRP